jgi:hypothetical protein
MIVGDTTDPAVPSPPPPPLEPLRTVPDARAQPRPAEPARSPIETVKALEPIEPQPGRGRGFEESTAVESPSEALLIASAQGTDEEIEADFHRVYDEFVATRQQCGETMEGVTFDKFAVKLRNNRSQLIQRYGCASVRFQVYIKDGKTALKATPTS